MCIDQVHKYLYFFFIVSYFIIIIIFIAILITNQRASTKSVTFSLKIDLRVEQNETATSAITIRSSLQFLFWAEENKTFYHLKKTRKWTRQNIEEDYCNISNSCFYIIISFVIWTIEVNKQYVMKICILQYNYRFVLHLPHRLLQMNWLRLYQWKTI